MAHRMHARTRCIPTRVACSVAKVASLVVKPTAAVVVVLGQRARGAEGQRGVCAGNGWRVRSSEVERGPSRIARRSPARFAFADLASVGCKDCHEASPTSHDTNQTKARLPCAAKVFGHLDGSPAMDTQIITQILITQLPSVTLTLPSPNAWRTCSAPNCDRAADVHGKEILC
ncbi:hypothetical protein BJ546DRAFT_686445 [Cryomyces antarcticus]